MSWKISENIQFIVLVKLDQVSHAYVAIGNIRVETSLIFVLVVILLSFHILLIEHNGCFCHCSSALFQWNIYPSLISWTDRKKVGLIYNFNYLVSRILLVDNHHLCLAHIQKDCLYGRTDHLF